MNETHFFAAEDTDEDEEGEGEEDADLGATSDTEPNSEPDSVDNEDAEDEEGDNYNLNGTNYWVSVSHIHFIVQSISCLGHVRVLFLPPAIIDIWSFLEEKIKRKNNLNLLNKQNDVTKAEKVTCLTTTSTTT